MESASTALAGVRVLDAASFVAGPLAAAMLGDLGADVVKLESPAGDPLRQIGGSIDSDLSATFAFVNRGKRSVVVDPAESPGTERVKALAAASTIVIHNQRPVAAQALGLEQAQVVVEISAFGREGPYAGRPALDPIVQAMAGIVSLTGEAEGEPHRAAAPVVDIATALAAAFAALAALREHERTGEAQQVTVSLFEVGLLLNAPAFAMHSARGGSLERLGNASHALLADQFGTRDGLLWLAVWEGGQWQRLCALLGLDELATEPAYQSNDGRLADQERLRSALRTAIAGWDGDELRERLEAEGIPAAITLTLEQVAADPHVLATGALRLEQRLGGQDLRLPAGPLRFAGKRPEAGAPAPRLGEHTDEVLRALAEAAPPGKASG